jgi:galactokinase
MDQMTAVQQKLNSEKMNERLRSLYGEDKEVTAAKERYLDLAKAFDQCFSERSSKEEELFFFSAPGRTEIGGNHTDHQHGRVLAAAVNLDIVAVAAKNSDGIIRLQSKGFSKADVIDLKELSVREEERERSASLIRGICARLVELGYQIGGFDAYSASLVLKGSGLSSSAAFEVLVVTILNHLYNDGNIDAVTVAQISQYAENVYFGKPSGLMDQTASSVGGFVAIDFCDPQKPVLEKIEFNPADKGYALCIVDTGGSHADLTADYASAPVEMKAVASALGHTVLRECDETQLLNNISSLREKVGDRAILRAIHFFGDNERVVHQTEALKKGDFEEFKKLSIESGRSSFMYLQNVYSCQNPQEQGLSLALAVAEDILQGRGAWRVHGGGFAGTIQAFVPFDLLDRYRSTMESIFGANRCYVLNIRAVGGTKVL